MSRNIPSNTRRRDVLDEYWFEKVVVGTKTAEEIREHTIPEDLPPVAKTFAMLDSRSDIQRLAGIRSLSTVILSDHNETIRRLLPKMKAIIEQTVDNEEHLVAAETIVSMIEQQSLTYSDFMTLFSQMICAFIFPATTNRFSLDFGAIWSQVLCKIIDTFPNTTSFTSLLDLIFNLSLHGSYVRDRLATVLAKLSCRLAPQIVENRLLPVFKNFINDTNADIRTLACQKLPILAQSLDLKSITTLILPLLVILSKDENLTVRQTCLESLLDLRNQLKDWKSTEQVAEMMISLVKFGLASKTPKFLTTIALRLSDLCDALTIFHIDEHNFIREIFLRLSEEKNLPECRLACANHFPAIIQYLGNDELFSESREVFASLCLDNDTRIRALMSSTILSLAEFSHIDDNKYFTILWDGFLTLLKDTNQSVILAMASNLLKMFTVFSRDEIEGFCNGSICPVPAVSDSEMFIMHLLEYERRIFEETLSWRSYICCLQAFVHLPWLLSSEQIHTKILPRIFSRIFSKQVCVREIAVDSYVQLLRKIPRRTVRKNAFQKLKSELLLNTSYQWRIMYIRVCRQVLVHYSKRFFRESFLDTILSLECDPVLSVRIQLVPLLIEIKSILRLPADRQSIGRIEKMMAYLLADKTNTLHDLANNGLLQLDQIRSYNTISTFSSHSSNDHNDQRKENEEDFLDQIDTSPRRSVSRSNEQHTISKRLTDTSITQKHSASTKNDLPRKVSLSADGTSDKKDRKLSSTKEQRRKTFCDSAIPIAPSRLSNQSSLKKNTKCKETSRE